MIRVSKLGRAVAALAVGASLLATTIPAEAGWRHGPYGGYGAGYGGRGGGYGWGRAGHPGGYGYAYRPHRNNGAAGAAIAAGLIGALALGAIASQSQAAPAYGYGNGYGYGAPCRVVNQQVYDAYGYPRWQQVQVCN